MISNWKNSRNRWLVVACIAVVALQFVQAELRADNPLDFLEISVGTLPIIITSPHGGGMIPSDVSPRVCDEDGEVCLNDQNTHLIAAAVGDELEALLGARPYQVINRIDRLYIDQNRSNAQNPFGENEAYEDADARPYYDFYHGAIRESIDRILDDHGFGLLVDVHGQSQFPNTVIRGTRNGQTVTRLLEVHGEEALTGPSSLFGHLETLGYPVTPPNAPLSEERETAYNGGHTVATYGSHRTLGIDSIQIEFSRDFRVSSGDPEVWEQSAADLAEAIKVFYEAYIAEPVLEGDYNDDGQVDAADYTIWRNNLGSTLPLPNDSIGGTVGIGQYNLWRENFGSSASGQIVTASEVPEPACLPLMAVGVATLLYRYRAGKNTV